MRSNQRLSPSATPWQGSREVRSSPTTPETRDALNLQRGAAAVRHAVRSVEERAARDESVLVGRRIALGADTLETPPLTPAKAWALLESQRKASPAAARAETEDVVYVDRNGRERVIHAAPDSPLAAAWVWAQGVATLYDCSRPAALWLLMTGKVLDGAPATATAFHGPGGMRLHITAWGGASDEQISGAVKAVRRRLAGRLTGTLPGEKRAAMVAWVDDLIAREGNVPWPQRWDRWKAHVPPLWAYSSSRAMWNAYTRAKSPTQAARRLALASPACPRQT